MIAYSVSPRTSEIGLRMAMGADRGQILRLVIAQSAVPVIWSTVIGLTLAVSAAVLLRHGLVGANLRDPAVFIVPVLILATAAFAASILPAYRAASVEPMEAQRNE